MKFLAEKTGKAEQRLLRYIIGDRSFDTEPTVTEAKFDLVINKLNLTVLDDNKIVQVWGFCPNGEWVSADYNVPKYESGILRIMEDLKPGFSYKLNKESDWEVYINVKTGWVCLGNPKVTGKAIEFINNCVAVLNKEGGLISLWLRPQFLPKL